MKKLLSVFTCCIAMYSCTMQPVSVDPRPSVACMVDTFVATHPNFMNNSITQEKANEEFKQAFMDSIEANPHFLDGVRLTLLEINETKKNGYVAHLRSDYNCYDKYNISAIHFDVIAQVTDSLVENLQERHGYYVNGEIVGAITFPVMQLLYGAPLQRYTDDYKIEKREYSDTYEVFLANLYMNITNFEPYH